MRILFVTPYVPSPIRLRPFELIKALSARHEVSLVSLVCDEYEWKLARQIEPYCASVDLVRLPKWQAYAHCLRALPTLEPLRVAYYRSSELARRIARVVREREIEVIHGELIKVVPALRAVHTHEKAPIVFDSVDCISRYLTEQQRAVRNPAARLFVLSELFKMRRYERTMLTAFEEIAIISERERDFLRSLGGSQRDALVVPNGIDTDYFAPVESPRTPDTLVFCAKLDYFPNAQAILRFSREILPLIWERHPGTHLTIVGNNPPRAVRSLAADPRITVTGYVPDTRPYLGQASVALSPLVVAAGIQNKVLEALSMATPLVATPASSTPIGVQNGVHLLVAENPRSFADAVLRLLDDATYAQSLGEAGRAYVGQRFSWSEAARAFESLYAVRAAPRGNLIPVNFSTTKDD